MSFNPGGQYYLNRKSILSGMGDQFYPEYTTWIKISQISMLYLETGGLNHLNDPTRVFNIYKDDSYSNVGTLNLTIGRKDILKNIFDNNIWLCSWYLI